MSNPFRLLWLMLTARRPSRITEMPILQESFWLGKGYEALTFFGHIVVHTQEEADALNERPLIHSSLKRHETIHLRQAQATHNSWLCFYILYIWYYVRALPQNRYMHNAAYYLNPFEIEAYAHMYEPDYLERCANGAQEWRRYAKMKPSERRKVTKR
jgi:hypothetical protein